MSSVPPSRERRRARRSTADVQIGVLTAGLAVIALAAQAAWLVDAPPVVGADVVRLLVLGMLFAATEKFVVTFPVRRGSHTISLSEIPLVVGLVILPVSLVVGVSVVGGLVGLIAFRRQRGSKLAFNTALYAVQATAANAVFHLITRSADPLGPLGWIGAYTATFITDIIAIVLISAVIALHDDSGEWRRLLTADIRGLFQLPLVAVTTTLGLVSAIVVRSQGRAAVLLGVLCFAIYRVFRRYAQQTQGHAQVEALYRFTRAMGGSQEADALARVVLSELRDLVRAETAELVLVGDGNTVRVRLTGEDDLETGTDPPGPEVWWAAAAGGESVLLAATASKERGAGPVDAMAVPMVLGDSTGVLMVTGSLPEVDTFTADHLRLMEALAGHACVALANVRLVEKLRHIGLHDALTGLPNRRKLLADLQQVATAPSPAAGVAGVLLFDLDRFKEINDALGHVIGDQVLLEIGRRLQQRFGDRATVARLGGDEFALVIPHAETTDQVLELAGELRHAVAEPIRVGELALATQASIGVCFFPTHGTDPDQLLRRADVAMYAAKQARSGIRVYRTADDQNTPRRLALLADLRTAVEGGGIDLVYQPKIDPVTRRVLGAEALSRWRHHDTSVPPDEFIPLAEQSGLILPLTWHVLDTAVASCAAWRRAGHQLSVAVNLSPHVIASRTLVAEVRQTLARHAVPAEALTLEITETGVMEDAGNSLRTLESLRAVGVKLSIDDFGTGHSSLGRLAEFPVDEVKIDKSLIRGLTTNRSNEALTYASLYLGQALGLHVVAEGVETEAEFEYLRGLGCDSIQGYYVSRPLPPDRFLRWVDTWQQTAPSPVDAAAIG